VEAILQPSDFTSGIRSNDTNSSSSRSKDGEDDDEVDGEDHLYQRRLAARTIPLLLAKSDGDSSSEDVEVDIFSSSSIRGQQQLSQADSIKNPPKTTYSTSTPGKNGVSTMVDTRTRDLDGERVPIEAGESSRKCCSISNATSNDIESSESPPYPRSCSSTSSQEGEVKEEAKEGIESISYNEQESAMSLQNEIPFRPQTQQRPSVARQHCSPILRNQNPNFSNGRQSNDFRSSRFQYGSNRVMNTGRYESSQTLGLVNEDSASDFSMTEFQHRVSSMFTAPSSGSEPIDSSAAVRQSAGRIARNISLYMRTGSLPVAATVVTNEADLENEMREHLEEEIRHELAIEMEKFRRRLVQQLMSAAEPVTADVISVHPRPYNGNENRPRDEWLNLMSAQIEREQAEGRTTRSDMNGQRSRMCLHMKNEQSLCNHESTGNLGGLHPIAEDDHENAHLSLFAGRFFAAIPTESNATWIVFVLVLGFGLILGIGIGRVL